MKHEVTSLNTKKLIAASLKMLMAKKPFSKITVSEIIADCGVNRKTFYYHFENVYDLLKWMLEQEAVEVVKQFDLLVDYEEAILYVLDYVEKNRHILNCAFDSIGIGELKRFFYNDFFNIMEQIVDGAAAELSSHADENYRHFLCRFYTEAISSMLLSYIRNEILLDHQLVVDYLIRTCKSGLVAALQDHEETLQPRDKRQ